MRFLSGFFILIALSGVLTGCASAPKPQTFGDKVGSAIDQTIIWSSKGIKKLLQK